MAQSASPTRQARSTHHARKSPQYRPFSDLGYVADVEEQDWRISQYSCYNLCDIDHVQIAASACDFEAARRHLMITAVPDN